MRSFLNSLLTITFALLFFYGCEVEEKKNIYQSPALQKYPKLIYAENFLLKDKASKINKDLSGLLGIEADFLIENKVSFDGEVIDELIGVLVVLVYTAIITWGLLKITEVIVGNRVSEDEEIGGLDLASHNERGYDM